MVLPIPPTVLPLHSLLVQPPDRVLKPTLWLRRLLFCFVLLHFVATIGFLISPAPSLALMNGVTVFVGFFAAHGKMPIRHYIHVVTSSIVFMMVTIRFSAKIGLPEFGYSKNLRILKLATEIQERLERNPDSLSAVYIPITVLSNQLDSNVVPDSTQPDSTKFRRQDELSKISSRLGSFFEQQSQDFNSVNNTWNNLILNKYDNSEDDLSISDSFTTMLSLNNTKSQQSFLDSVTTPLVVRHTINPSFTEQSFENKTKLTHTGSQAIEMNRKRLLEYINFQPAYWRILVEQISLIVASISSGFSALVSFVLARKFEKIVATNISNTLNGHVEHTDEENHQLVVSPSPYALYATTDRNNLLNERHEDVFTSFLGEGVSVAQLLPQDTGNNATVHGPNDQCPIP